MISAKDALTTALSGTVGVAAGAGVMYAYSHLSSPDPAAAPDSGVVKVGPFLYKKCITQSSNCKWNEQADYFSNSIPM